MKQATASVFYEAGVEYCRVDHPVTRPALKGMFPVKYHRQFLGEGFDPNNVGEVYVWKRDDIFKLVDHWNRGSAFWKYWVVL